MSALVFVLRNPLLWNELDSVLAQLVVVTTRDGAMLSIQFCSGLCVPDFSASLHRLLPSDISNSTCSLIFNIVRFSCFAEHFDATVCARSAVRTRKNERKREIWRMKESRQSLLCILCCFHSLNNVISLWIKVFLFQSFLHRFLVSFILSSWTPTQSFLSPVIITFVFPTLLRYLLNETHCRIHLQH